MLANLLHFLNRRRAAEEYDLAFVKGIEARPRPPRRNRKSERVLVVGWVLIGLKCWASWWAIDHFAMPIDPWWIVLPTLLSAAVCTWVYLRRA